MRVVAFISPKGGAGKTTAALTLALGLLDRGQRVAMIDSDPNKPLIQWIKLPGCPENLSVHPAPTLQDINDALRDARRRNPDWIILDTEGQRRKTAELIGPATKQVLDCERRSSRTGH